MHSENLTPGHTTSGLMDNLFASICLYEPETYLRFISQNGLEVVASSKLDPLGRSVDHTYAHPSTILMCRKVRHVSDEQIDDSVLSPERSIDQINNALYDLERDEAVLKTLTLYRQLKKQLCNEAVPEALVLSLVFKMSEIVIKNESRYNQGEIGLEEVVANRHPWLQYYLEQAIELSSRK